MPSQDKYKPEREENGKFSLCISSVKSYSEKLVLFLVLEQFLKGATQSLIDISPPI